MEQSLRARVRGGDPDAFGVLFDDCARAVYNLAFRLRGNWQEAEEIVSLTFLEAWRLRARIEPDGESLRPWLMGIAVNVTRNFSRASRRHQAAMARLPDTGAVPDFADEVAARIDDAARLARVRAAFGRLRPGEQEVIALCVWSDLDYAAAAEALGVPVGTVRSRLSRARRKLRASAGEPGPGGAQEEDDRQMAARPPQGGNR
jgi:RNA polymerase sigma-70 factor (ECF subfamily)